MRKQPSRYHGPAVAALFSIAIAVILASCATPAATPPATPTATPTAAQPSDWRSVTLDVQRVAAAGTKIAWAQLGSGPPLIMLNGTGSPMSEWDPWLLSELASTNRVIVFDYPGLGQSGPAPAPLTFENMASWTASFLKEIGVERANVLGWSMGGFVAQRMSLSHAGVVDKLILAATNPGSPRTQLGPLWAQEADSDPDGSLETYLKTNYPPIPEAQSAGKQFLDRVEAAVNSGRYPKVKVPARTYDAMVEAEDPWLRSDSNIRQLPTVSAKTLVLGGSEDVITPPENSRIISQEVPGAKLSIYPSSGHSFLFQQPVTVARDINDFTANG